MPIRKLMTTLPREYLNKEDYMSAFAMASADLESILFQKLLFEKAIKAELMENWSLSTFIRWSIKLELIETKWETLLNDFRKLRNKVIHGRGFLAALVKEPDKLKSAQELLISVCNFIDQVEVVYRSRELDSDYSKSKKN